VQLDEVQRVDAEVGPRPVVPGAEVLARVVLRHLRDAPAHLGGDGDPRVRATLPEEAADEGLAAAVAVDVGGVEERDPAVHGGVQHGERVRVVDLTPVRPELPAAEPDHPDLTAEPLRHALLHVAEPMQLGLCNRPGRSFRPPGMHLVRTVIGLAVLVLAACGQPADPAAPRGPAPTPVGPAALLGTWAVSGIDAEGVVLTIDPTGFELRDGTGVRFGSWRADPSGTFVASVTGARGATAGEPGTPPWLAAATTVAADGSDLVLRDAAGAQSARLTPQPGPPPVPGRPEVRSEPAAPLPAGLVPAERSRLVGRWVPADPRPGRAPQPPHVELAADGAWTGSDGCNAAAGRWTSGPDGLLLATSGPQTLIACEGMVGVPGWLALATRAGFDTGSADDAVLVLLAPDGAELGRLRPA
jgi:hypothetical protein